MVHPACHRELFRDNFPPMPKRLSIVCLLAAWLCADGNLLDVTQVVAWARMFAGYAQTHSIAEAAALTVDPSRPCDLCKAVRRARESSEPGHVPAATAAVQKFLFAQPESAALVLSPPGREWPEWLKKTGPTRSEPVPVPPPRATLRSQVV